LQLDVTTGGREGVRREIVKREGVRREIVERYHLRDIG